MLTSSCHVIYIIVGVRNSASWSTSIYVLGIAKAGVSRMGHVRYARTPQAAHLKVPDFIRTADACTAGRLHPEARIVVELEIIVQPSPRHVHDRDSYMQTAAGHVGLLNGSADSA